MLTSLQVNGVDQGSNEGRFCHMSETHLSIYNHNPCKLSTFLMTVLATIGAFWEVVCNGCRGEVNIV